MSKLTDLNDSFSDQLILYNTLSNFNTLSIQLLNAPTQSSVWVENHTSQSLIEQYKQYTIFNYEYNNGSSTEDRYSRLFFTTD